MSEKTVGNYKTHPSTKGKWGAAGAVALTAALSAGSLHYYKHAEGAHHPRDNYVAEQEAAARRDVDAIGGHRYTGAKITGVEDMHHIVNKGERRDTVTLKTEFTVNPAAVSAMERHISDGNVNWIGLVAVNRQVNKKLPQPAERPGNPPLPYTYVPMKAPADTAQLESMAPTTMTFAPLEGDSVGTKVDIRVVTEATMPLPPDEETTNYTAAWQTLDLGTVVKTSEGWELARGARVAPLQSGVEYKDGATPNLMLPQPPQ